MKNIFRAIAYLFLTVVFFGSLSLFLFQEKTIAYLNLAAQASSNNKSKAVVVVDSTDASIDPDSVFNDQKFIKLQKAVVDSTGLNLPSPQTGTSTVPDGQEQEKLPDFKVGNSNPFKPF